MIYVSVDIETTGLDENENQMIEFAAIIEDTKNPKPFDNLPKFRRIVLNRNDKYVFQSFACNLNKKLIEEIAYLTPLVRNGYVKDSESLGKVRDFFKLQYHPNYDNNFCMEDELSVDFKQFLEKNGINGRFVIAGKNVMGFDSKFMNKLPNFSSTIKYHHRHIDPAQSFIDWDIDEVPPSMELCKKRASLPTEVSHRAIEDAWDVIMLVRASIEIKKRLMVTSSM